MTGTKKSGRKKKISVPDINEPSLVKTPKMKGRPKKDVSEKEKKMITPGEVIDNVSSIEEKELKAKSKILFYYIYGI